MFGAVMFLATAALAISAGYLSVMGFAMTFQSTFWQAFALAASLEVGKLVAASFLYRYWHEVRMSMRVGMMAAVIGLMIFTSAGIYGYLSASYQTSSVSLNVNTQRVAMLEEERARSISRKAEIDKQITNLPADYVRSRQKLMASFGSETERLDKRITEIDTEMLTLKQQTIQDESHVGPVIFVAKTMGIESDAAVAWFILLVVLVFDPLAIMMTLGTNHVLLEAGRRKKGTPMTTVAPPLPITPPPLEPMVPDEPVEHIIPLDPLEHTEPHPIAPEPDRLQGIERALNQISEVVLGDAERARLKRDLLSR